MTPWLFDRGRRIATIITVLLALIPLVPAPAARAQTTSGTLVGTVYRPDGTPLGGARVTATNEINGNSRSTITGADGSYRIPFMPPGRYTIRASSMGFTDSQITGFPIPLNSTTNLVPPITLGQVGGPVTTTPIGPTTPVGPTTGTTGTTGTTVQAPSTRTEGEARASLVNTNDATRRANFNEYQVETLPLGGTTETRTFDELALLAPGVAPAPYTPGVRGPGVGFGIGTAGQFSVNGQRARSNNFTVDGSDNNDPDVGVRRQGFVALVPQSIESIQEYQLSTLLWNAEAGRNVGSQVNAVSKTGGNEFHGQVYGFFTDSSLNARNFFDYGDESPYTRVQTGFVLGGPLYEDRTQFFATYERLEINGAVEQHFASPTFTERRFFNLPAFGVVPPFPNADPPDLGFFTTAGATPIGANVLSFYPFPNNPGGPYGANTYSEQLPASGNGNIFSFKVTHRFDENNFLNARYNFTDDDRVLPSVNRAIRSTINSESQTHNLSLILDTAFGPNVFNQFRFSYGRTEIDFPEHPSSPFLFEQTTVVPIIIDEEGNVANFLSRTFPIGELIIEPFSPVGVDVYTFPQGRENNTFQIADSVAWSVGSHSLRFGADIRFQQFDSFQDRNYRPLVTYGNGVVVFGLLDLTGDPEDPFVFNPTSSLFALQGAQFATFGTPTSLFQTITAGEPDSRVDLSFGEYNFFFNDTWRVRPNFTLDYGVRYEYNSVPKSRDDRIESALGLQNLPTAGNSSVDDPLATAVFNLAVAGYQQFLDGRDRIYDSDTNNFGPHVGFAWDPWGDGRTAIRAGYGVYFDTILGAVVTQSRNVFPNEVPINVDPAFLGTNIFDLPNPATLFLEDRQGNPVFLVRPGTVNQFGGSPNDFVAVMGTLFAQNFGIGGLAFTLPTKDLATPYVQQWHLTVERQFLGDYAFSAGYVGTKGTKLLRLTTPNLGPNVTPFLPVGVNPNFDFPIVPANLVQSIIRQRPYPFLGAIQIFENTASSNYHALQLEARKRYSSGYEFTASYTWSHAIDDVSDVFPIAGAPTLPQDSFNFALERADANFDVRHRYAFSLIYDLPFYRDSAGADAGSAAFWAGGWQVATILQGNTGQPFTINIPFDLNLDGNLTDRPLTDRGLVYIDEHGPQRVRVADNASLSDFVFYQFGFLPQGNIFLIGADGTVGRNTVRADSLVNWDLALNKHFRFGETQDLEFRTEVFNVLNRANFGIPIRTVFNPGFGSAVETATPARTIQFALKYSF